MPSGIHEPNNNPAICRQAPTAQNDTHQEPLPPTDRNQISNPRSAPKKPQGASKARAELIRLIHFVLDNGGNVEMP